MNQLKNKLHALQHIQPDAGFVLRAKNTVSALPQFKKTAWMHICESMYYSLALGLGSLLLITLVGQLSYMGLFNSSPVIIGSLQTKALGNEEALTNFELQIAEAQYFEDTATAVASALKIVRTETPNHLNDELLNQELKQIETTENPAS